MKVYEYSEVQGYNNIDEIMREKTIVFGSINEGRIVMEQFVKDLN